MFGISYNYKVEKDLEKIDRAELLRIHEAVERKLTSKPHLYGARLRGELKEYWKLRVGDYRIVYKIQKKIVIIIMIGHRKEIYKMAEERV